jgi:hypothetical protein
MTRRLDHTTRQSIAKKMRGGMRPEVLAREYGVSVRTVYRCAQFMRQLQIERGSRTETVVCRVSPAELALFDERLRAAGLDNRSEALRSVIRSVGGMAAPDAELAEALHAMKAALNRVGNNVSQIARRMNAAKNRGQALPFSETDHAEIRHLAGMVLDFADEIALMAQGRRNTLELTLSDELKALARRKGL